MKSYGEIMNHLDRQICKIFESICDLQLKYKRNIVDDDSEQSVTFFLNTILPEELHIFDVLLHGKMYFLNERISFVDYTMVEMLRLLLTVDENSLNAYPSVLQFYENMRNRPNIAAYLQ
ncbi:Glutathione S-transferase P 10 [Trichinella papuae]|uniref:Glutathione S-transferase P 10 n=1 Tax=Trichinella papuae TaxID=268474 RepID=A0A0V1M2G3_9BILA|nr:Glutathione S-transferase P 10 [Trichinella papuae]